MGTCEILNLRLKKPLQVQREKDKANFNYFFSQLFFINPSSQPVAVPCKGTALMSPDLSLLAISLPLCSFRDLLPVSSTSTRLPVQSSLHEAQKKHPTMQVCTRHSPLLTSIGSPLPALGQVPGAWHSHPLQWWLGLPFQNPKFITRSSPSLLL